MSRDKRRRAELTAILHDIRTGPQGPAVGAFFDFDGTVIHGFNRFLTRWTVPRQNATPRAMTWSLLSCLSGRKTIGHLHRIESLISQVWRGYAERDLERVEDRLFTRFIAGRLFPEAWQLIRAHHAAGHTLVIATAATRFHVSGFARELGIDHVLCTEVAVADGVLTGNIDGSLVYSQCKADAVAKCAIDNDIDLTCSYGYSNGGEDLPLLSLVGKPNAVNPDDKLVSAAIGRNWRVLQFRSPGQQNPYRMARTVIGLVAILCAAGAAFLSSLGQDRRFAINRMYNWVSRAGLRCAGLRICLSGSEHARAPRPAVFIFNHQSQIDTLIVPYVLGTGFTGVVAMKARRYPVFGSLLRFVGAAFIDTSTPGQAKRALDPLVTELQAGNSVAIAPEGRVSPTPELLNFKKGAFHLASRAGVPIIPIVIRNSGRALWRSAMFVRPGTIEVAMLEPIDISTWKPDDYDDHIESIRQLYLETLTYWSETVG